MLLNFFWNESNSNLVNLRGAGIVAVSVAKLYFPVETLSTQDNSNLFQELKSEFKRTINWNNYQSKVVTQTQNQY